MKHFCCASYIAEIIAAPGRNGYEMHNEECLADFSSRGPTADGRIKPEIVAPGQYVISSRADGIQYTPSLRVRPGMPAVCNGDQCCAPINNNAQTSDLLSMAGTSMATPITAGAAALVRQYYRQGYYPSGSPNPSDAIASPPASLIVATMANGAHTLTGKIDLFNDGTTFVSLNNPGTWPMYQIFQGFGRVNLSESLHFANNSLASTLPERPSLAADWTENITTSQVALYRFVVRTKSTLKATLVWHDYPGQLGAALAIVNDLDLYVGKNITDAVAGNYKKERDERNNVEHALYDAEAGDVVYVEVYGYHVPMGPQPFSLVVSGDFQPFNKEVDYQLCNTECPEFNIPPGTFSVYIPGPPPPQVPEDPESEYPYGLVIAGVLIGLLVIFCGCYLMYSSKQGLAEARVLPQTASARAIREQEQEISQQEFVTTGPTAAYTQAGYGGNM
eukprot:g20204.t1